LPFSPVTALSTRSSVQLRGNAESHPMRTYR
jgi:hypothetical protein